MAGFRNQTINALQRAKQYLPIRKVAQLNQQRFISVLYHLISDEEVPHVKHLYEVKGRKAFEKDLDYLLDHYIAVDLQMAIRLIRSGEPIDRKYCLLTFDDGLREFNDVIAPILNRKGVPAAVFLNSAFVDNKDLFYRYKVSLLLEHFEQNPQLLKYKTVLNFFNKKNYSFAKLKRKLLKVNYQNKSMLDRLAEVVELDFNAYLKNHQPYLTSDQIRSLIKQDFDFGAHSIDHPEYRFLSLEEQLRQTEVSVDFVSRQFNLDYSAFAFPFTDYQVSDIFFEMIYEDKELLDISFGCAGIKKDILPQHMQRISLEMAHLSAEEIIEGELIYHMLKAPFNKNKIERSLWR